MAIRKHGTETSQQVDASDDPGQGQGIERTGSSHRPGATGPSQPPSPEERDEIIRGEG